jgi:NhaP-type Na+/H+ or K+/H+ antiporter
MTSSGILVVAVVLIGYGAVSGRLAGTVVTPAIVFVGVGLLLGDAGLDVFAGEISAASVRVLAEATLALVLFSDASALDTRALRRESGLPVRLLTVGLPITIVLGSLLAMWWFTDLVVWEAVVLAVMLAPTDAALGQAVVSDPRLPSKLRQGLNVESGLNDGVCVPLLMAAVAFATLEEAPSWDGGILVDLVRELAIAAAVGAAVAFLAATVWKAAERRHWITEHWAQVFPLATVVVAYVATDELGGSGFIACFVGGLVFGRLLGPARGQVIEFSEQIGGVLSAVTFFLFAAVLAGPAFDRLDATTVLYAVLSLTVIRMLPVALSFIGTGSPWQTVVYAGWFGPRGLATIVFGLTIIGESGLTGIDRITDVATITVLLSVLAHGVTAPALTDRYVAWRSGRADLPPVDDETAPVVTEMGSRGGLWRHHR